MTGARELATPLFLALLLIGTIGCDRVTKRIASETLAGGADRSFLAGTVRVAYAENPGGFLSLGAAWPAAGRAAVFVVASGALLALVAGTIVRAQWDRSGLLGATLFLAGGGSNWIDRVLHGRVVDFLNVGVGPWRTGIFNVADVAIMLGLGLLLVGNLSRQPSADFPAD